jgi:hypothetical protein
MTLDNYRILFERELIGTVLWNTVILTIVTSTGTVLISFLISLVVVRSKFWGRRVLDQLAFAPHAIPGIVMGVAFLWLFLQADNQGLPLFGGLVSIAIAFTIGYLSYGTRVMNAAILQIHKDLEEAAYVSGAVQWRTMWRMDLDHAPCGALGEPAADPLRGSAEPGAGGADLEHVGRGPGADRRRHGRDHDPGAAGADHGGARLQLRARRADAVELGCDQRRAVDPAARTG